MTPDVNLAIGPTAAGILTGALGLTLTYFELRLRPLLVEALAVYREREKTAEAQVAVTKSLASGVHKLAARAA